MLIMNSTDKQNTMYSNTMFNITRILILGVMAENSDLNVKSIIQATGISQRKIHQELNVLKNAEIITTCESCTKSGLTKKMYKINPNKYHLLWTKTIN